MEGLRELRNLLPCPALHSLCGKCPSKSSVKVELLEKKITTTHRVQEHELLKRLENFCKRAGLEFPTEAEDDRKIARPPNRSPAPSQ